MSKMHRLVNEFLSGNKKETLQDPQTVTAPNSFRALFDFKDLEKDEVQKMQEIFQGHVQGEVDEESLRDDFRSLIELTAELKAIQKQAILLIGERVFKAREIFARYSEERGAFTAWLEWAFNSRKTAYNALAFFEFYEQLPTDDLKGNFKKMPAKAGYALASRKGDLLAKQDLILEYQGETQKEVLEKIEERFPLKKGDKRSPKDLAEKTLDEMERLVDVLDRRIALVRLVDKERVEKMILRLRTLLDTYFK